MKLDRFTTETDGPVRRYEYDDSSMLAVDFGPRHDASVDLVDGTVIVVDGDDQYELELPQGAGDAHTFIKNGVLTVEVEADQ
ncbi:DUF7127 family protein [Natrarchaeobius chitinivorans]|uniref:Hsp20/alpha crystallin family protein n=1 Tax=Natrarchaeobius chitinivorans TaxID=1679083 RepID=A0A3N6MMY3_NATCH|nr:Hsp20/alpha crystallin family protein [Natrarchaeobius chitinivorans]RQG95856.1 Hsp20/alpha crystallin family protein [Natrarchaeobius chitinivorans]